MDKRRYNGLHYIHRVRRAFGNDNVTVHSKTSAAEQHNYLRKATGDSGLLISIKHSIEAWCSPDNRKPGAQRLLPMEGLRGLAVLLVFMVHYNALFGFLLTGNQLQASICALLALVGHSGVDLFFVMSGFLIYAAALKPGLNYFAFMKRRIVRIYPAFLAVLSIYLVLSYRFPEYSKLRSQLPWQTTLYIVENILLLPGMLAIIPIITVAWSLSYEMFYYLCLPAMTLATRMSSWAAARRIVGISCASLVFYLACWFGQFDHVQLLMFAGGMLLYELMSSERLENLFSTRREIAVVVLFVVSLGASAVTSHHVRALILYLGIVPFALFCFRFQGWIGRFFRWWPLRAWGNISYSYYLLHGLILNGLAHIWPKSVQAPFLYWLFLPFALMVTMIGSFVLFVLIERPVSLAASTGKKYENRQSTGTEAEIESVMHESVSSHSNEDSPNGAGPSLAALQSERS